MKYKVLLLLLLSPLSVFSMHIMEGFLPIEWALTWWVAIVPVFILGLRQIKKQCAGNANAMLLLALAGAFTFILSALKLPSLTGSCSHPTGMGLGTLLFGPVSIVVVGIIVLFFQAILLAHGGITTLGANSFSMAFVGPLVTWGVYHLVKKVGGKQSLAVFLSVSIGGLATYCITAVQLALAHPAEQGGFMESLQKFFLVFAPTQLPISIIEGLFTVVVINAIQKYRVLDIGVFRVSKAKS